MNALLSVIVPVYKVEPYLRRCVDSILAQTYRNLEIVLVDDCSPDDCGRICDEYGRLDPRVKVVHNEANRGLFVVRRIGIEHASGDWIAFVDSDDYIYADRFEVMMRAAVSAQADAVWGDVVTLEETGGRCFYRPMSDLLTRHAPMCEHAAFNQMMKLGGFDWEWHVVWAKIYRKDVALKAAKVFSDFNDHLVMCEDVAWSVALMNNVRSLAFAHGSPYVYFRNCKAATTSNDSSDHRLMGIARDLERVRRLVVETCRRVMPELDAERYVSRWIGCYAKGWLVAATNSTPEVKEAFEGLCVADDRSGVRSDAIRLEVPKSEICRICSCARWYRFRLGLKRYLRYALYPLVVVTRPLRWKFRSGNERR